MKLFRVIRVFVCVLKVPSPVASWAFVRLCHTLPQRPRFRCPAGAGPEVRRVGPAAQPGGWKAGPGARGRRTAGRPRRPLCGEDAGGRWERARPRDGRYKSAAGGRFAPAAPPRWPRSFSAPRFPESPTCGCGSRPRHHDRYRPPPSPPEPPAPLPAFRPGEFPAGRRPPQSCRLAAAGRAASCVSCCPAAPGGCNPGAQRWGSQAELVPSAGALVPASVSLPFLLLSP